MFGLQIACVRMSMTCAVEYKKLSNFVDFWAMRLILLTLVPCAINGNSTILEKSEVYIVVSMSHDRIQTDPKKSIRKLATKLLDRMQTEVKKIEL